MSCSAFSILFKTNPDRIPVQSALNLRRVSQEGQKLADDYFDTLAKVMRVFPRYAYSDPLSQKQKLKLVVSEMYRLPDETPLLLTRRNIERILDDRSLVTFAKYIALETEQEPQIDSAEEARAFLDAPVQAQFLANVSSLDNFRSSWTGAKMPVYQFPVEIVRLRNLTELWFTNAKLVELPPAIGALTGLVALRVTHCYLEELPSALGNLAALEILDVNENRLGALPSEIGKLTRLRKLIASCNKITTVPNEIGELPQLTNLDLRANEISHLPPAVQALNRRYINLVGNPIPKYRARDKD